MEPIWEAFNVLFFLLETSLTCIMTILRHGPLDTMPILRLDYFSTGANMRQALLATSLLWDMSFFLQQPLWDMTILRHDIFPTATIMRHDPFETWHFETWPFWDVTILRHDIFPTATIMRHDIFPTTTIMKDDHLETWFFCYYIHNLIWEKNLSTSDAPNNQPSLGGLTCLLLWPFWDMITW